MTMPIDRRILLLGSAGLAAGCAATSSDVPAVPDQIEWTFDRLDSIGGETTHAEGAPTLIDSPYGRAVKFDGVDDALFIERHPLAGASTFTFEALFRPDGGAFEQRWFHLAADPIDTSTTPSPNANNRIMFEIRVVEGGWYLDAFTRGPGYNLPLVFPDKLHPIGEWAHVAQSYDGRTYRSFVNGVLQGEGEIAFVAQGPGRASVGTRINRVNYFNGAVREARFTPRALSPDAFARHGLPTRPG